GNLSVLFAGRLDLESCPVDDADLPAARCPPALRADRGEEDGDDVVGAVVTGLPVALVDQVGDVIAHQTRVRPGRPGGGGWTDKAQNESGQDPVARVQHATASSWGQGAKRDGTRSRENAAAG